MNFWVVSSLRPLQTVLGWVFISIYTSAHFTRTHTQKQHAGSQGMHIFNCTKLVSKIIGLSHSTISRVYMSCGRPKSVPNGSFFQKDSLSSSASSGSASTQSCLCLRTRPSWDSVALIIVGWGKKGVPVLDYCGAVLMVDSPEHSIKTLWTRTLALFLSPPPHFPWLEANSS